MLEIQIDQVELQSDLIEEVADAIKAGAVVAFPTDTVYGLGAALFNQTALDRIFAIKGRLASKGLIAMIADIKDLGEICSNLSKEAETLMSSFWPGPLTLILPAAASVPDRVKVDNTLGVRLPDNELIRRLIRAAGLPLATTSANISGQPSLTEGDDVKKEFGDKVDILVSGLSQTGIESTIVDMTVSPMRIIRQGELTEEDLKERLKA